MMKAERKDKNLVIDILSRAYEENPTINETIVQDCKRHYRLRNLMAYSFEVSHEFGQVFLSDDREAVALIIFPDKKRVSLKSIIWDMKLLLFCSGFSRAIKALQREKALKKIHPKGGQIYHIWYLGTNPTSTGKGIGASLMKDLIEDSFARNRPIYVEARIRNNMLWYQKFDFAIYDELIWNNRKWFCLKREIRPTIL